MTSVNQLISGTPFLFDPSQAGGISKKSEQEASSQKKLSTRVNIDSIDPAKGTQLLKKTARANKELAQQMRSVALENSPLELEDLLKRTEPGILKAILNAKDEEGNTALLLCAVSGSKRCMHLLLDAGADALISNNKGNNFLHLAAGKGNSGILEIFLERLSKDREISSSAYQKILNAVNNEGFTPFLLCPYSNNIASMLLLLDQGVEPQQKDKESGRSLVHFAALFGHPEMLHAFFKRIAADPKISKELCRQMVNEGSSKSELTPLFLTTISKDIACMNLLLEQGADPFYLLPTTKKTFIQLAAEEGLIDMLKAYYKYISLGGNEKVRRCKALINNPDSEGCTPLLKCTPVERSIEIMNFLLDLGANPYCRDLLGNNFVHYAVMGGQPKLLESFLDRLSVSPINRHRSKKMLHAKNSVGKTPIFYCRKSKGPQYLNLLLEKGAKIFVVDDRGATPYLNALEYGEDASARAILEKEPRFGGMAAANIMGHVFGFDIPPTRLSGVLGKSISFSGSSYIFMHKLILMSLEQSFVRETFFSKVQDDQYAQLLVAFTRSCMLNPPAIELAEIIQKKELVILPTGWKEHGVDLVFYKGYMTICNRGEGCPEKLGEFRTFFTRMISLDQITLELMETILDIYSRSDKEGIEFFYRTLPKKLKAKKDRLCRKIEAIKPKYSKADVCAYNSAKAALRASLAMLAKKGADLEEYAKVPSKQWSIHHRKWALAYFKSAPSPFTPAFRQMMIEQGTSKIRKRERSCRVDRRDSLAREEEATIEKLVSSKL